MDYRDLQALRAVVVSGTTKGAALGLGVSQPTISRSISQIESDFGRSVFTRHKGRLVPTPFALQISDRVKQIDEILETLRRDILESDTNRTLRIGVTSDSSGEALQRTIRYFHSLYPHTEIRLEMSDRARFGTAIADGRMDLGITTNPIGHDGVTAELLYSCNMCCLLPAGHRLSASDEITPEQLAGEQLIAISDNSELTAQLNQALIEANVSISNRIVVSSARLAYDLVAPGLGIAIATPLPFTSGPLSHAIVFRPFSVRIPWRLFSLLAPDSPRHQLARQFCRMFRRVTSSLAIPAADPSRDGSELSADFELNTPETTDVPSDLPFDQPITPPASET